MDPKPRTIGRVKKAIRGVVPFSVYQRGSDILRRWQTLGLAVRSGIPNDLFFFGVAPGDDLLCTAVLRELRKRGRNSLWMMSNYPELFSGMDDVARVVPVDGRIEQFVKAWGRNYYHLEYAPVDYAADRSLPPEQHIIAELCARAGVTGDVALRPYLKLAKNESARAAWATDCIVIQSSGLAGALPMRNKQWFPERFQGVVTALQGKFEFVQLGSASDPPLQYAKDLRGATGIRETAAILSVSRLFVGNVGFLMHLARAVDCPAVIIYGGREAPWQSGYDCNTNLYSPVPCAPCWLWNRCDYERKCMNVISILDVVNAIQEQIGKARAPLAVSTTTI